MAQMVKSLPAMQETRVRSLGWGRFPGEGNGKTLQYSCLKNSMDGGPWQSWDRKESDMTERLHLHLHKYPLNQEEKDPKPGVIISIRDVQFC